MSLVPHLRIVGIYLILCATLCMAGGQALALSIDGARFGLHPDKTRVVLELSEAQQFRVFTLADPYRLVVDLPDFTWNVSTISKPSGSGITAIRQGALKPGISRIVIDLDRPMELKSAYILRADAKNANRLVIDIATATPSAFLNSKGKIQGTLAVDGEEPEDAKSGTQVKSPKVSSERAAMVTPTPPPVPAARAPSQINATTAATPEPPALTAPATPVSVSGMLIPQRKPAIVKYEKPLIVLDAGHGGVDPGAISSGGTLEKNITLSMAKDLKAVLEASGRYKVVLTRSSDRYLRLYERVKIARDAGADLFVSLHADSIQKDGVRGASIYTLSEKASDAQTERLAARENRADLIAGVDLSHEDADVATILVDLAMRDTMNQSSFFANTLVTKMSGHGLRLLESPHRSAGFAVLKAPDIPSVLIELGFLSNNSDARDLSSPDHRKRLATTIVNAIDAYFTTVRYNNRT